MYRFWPISRLVSPAAASAGPRPREPRPAYVSAGLEHSKRGGSEQNRDLHSCAGDQRPSCAALAGNAGFGYVEHGVDAGTDEREAEDEGRCEDRQLGNHPPIAEDPPARGQREQHAAEQRDGGKR